MNNHVWSHWHHMDHKKKTAIMMSNSKSPVEALVTGPWTQTVKLEETKKLPTYQL